jgi:acetyl-CoA carboxylase biotin carboxyl carrier protein
MSQDESMIESTWAEARDLIRRLEGTSVQRFAVKAGDYEIEIERGAVVQAAPADGEPPLAGGHLAPGATVGLGVSPAARSASGAFSTITEVDNRVPVLSPLVGTFYRAAQPGAKPFVEEGDSVDLGQTVCIVEAMKLFNELEAEFDCEILELLVENGQPVEYGAKLYRVRKL